MRDGIMPRICQKAEIERHSGFISRISSSFFYVLCLMFLEFSFLEVSMTLWSSLRTETKHTSLMSIDS